MIKKIKAGEAEIPKLKIVQSIFKEIKAWKAENAIKAELKVKVESKIKADTKMEKLQEDLNVYQAAIL